MHTRIRLREICREDVERINRWRNDKDVIDLLGNNFLFIGSDVDGHWFEQYLHHRDTHVRLAILDNASERHIGNVQLTNIHPINRSAEFSIFIGEKTYWSKGFGSEATQQMIEHGFRDRNLHRIYLTVLESNVRAIEMYKKVGFVYEGTMRDAVFKNNSYHSLVAMAIIRSNAIR
jgi:RimJ/RimL family protein N-acetyltransferase